MKIQGFCVSKAPSILPCFNTADGGQNWRQAQFEQLPQGYTMAYAPSVCEEGLELYVGMGRLSERERQRLADGQRRRRRNLDGRPEYYFG